MVVLPRFLIGPLLFMLAGLTSALGQEFDADLELVSAEISATPATRAAQDIDTSLDELGYYIVPLNVQQLAETAIAWQLHLQATLLDYAYLNVELLSATESRATEIRLQLLRLGEISNSIRDRYELVLKNWELKGGKQDDVDSHWAYLEAVPYDAFDTIDSTIVLPSDDPYSQCRNSPLPPGAGEIGGPFTLVNGDGVAVTAADVITGPTLVYFGYTFCPEICAIDLQRNSLAIDLLEKMGIEAMPVFISIDPDRDTPEAVSDFAANMHPRMLGLTGTPEQVKAAVQAFKAYYRKQDGDDDQYLIDHSTFTYLILPEVGFLEFYRRDSTAYEIARSVACFAKAG